MATFTITTDAYINQPPTQVGDGSTSTSYGVTYTFTRADFTTLTTPAYSDPEGDAAGNLRVLTLPSTGSLEYNSTPVTINQVISFSDIDSGLFTYIPDNATTSTYDDTFTFEIADVGSGTYTS